jgi:Heterokaryon incompatibility protein (HET)
MMEASERIEQNVQRSVRPEIEPREHDQRASVSDGEYGQVPWPRLTAVSKLPKDDWIEVLRNQIQLSASNNDNFFRYTPIEAHQVRLLFLIPSKSRDDVLEAMMFVANFPDVTLTGWCALSYTWGNAQELPGIIIIDGCKMKITENLELALRDVRNEHNTPYWVDAICINQADPVEKAHQIEHMRFMYEKASCVRAWLGPCSASVQEALQFAAICDERDGKQMVAALLSNPVMRNGILDGLTALFHLPYWRRIWVLQELVCGNEIYVNCGDREVPMDNLFRIAHYLHATLRMHTKGAFFDPQIRGTTTRITFDWEKAFENRVKGACDAIRVIGLIEVLRNARLEAGRTRIAVEQDAGTALLGCLDQTGSHQASDPRDKVFALLGIVEDLQWSDHVFPIDYERSVEETFIDVAKWIIISSSTLAILTGPRPLEQTPTKLKLPSWCPDWSIERTVEELYHISPPNIPTLDKLWKPAEVTFDLSGRIMTARGLLIDTCHRVGGEFAWKMMYLYQYLALAGNDELHLSRGYSAQQALEIKTEIELLAGLTAMTEATQYSFADLKSRLERLLNRIPQLRSDPIITDRLEVLWRTILLCPTFNQLYQGEELIQTMRHIYGWAEETFIPPPQETLSDHHQKLSERAYRCTHGRQIAVTQRGHIALLPLTAKPGDIICNLFGCLHPVVFRPEALHYTFIGEAFIHSYMLFEAFQKAQEGTLRQMSFVIC